MRPSNNNVFGERIKELRQERNVTQVELAEAIDFSKGIISLWENGRREPTASAIVACADFFGVTTDYLLGRSDV